MKKMMFFLLAATVTTVSSPLFAGGENISRDFADMSYEEKRVQLEKERNGKEVEISRYKKEAHRFITIDTTESKRLHLKARRAQNELRSINKKIHALDAAYNEIEGFKE